MNQALYFHSEISSSGSQASPDSSNPESSHTQTRVFLVDDHPAIREALSSAISEAGMQVVGDSARASDAVPIIKQRVPDVLVVDISLEDEDGLSLIESIRSRVPEVRILVFSVYDENVYAERAIRAGASGYVMKTEPTQTVIRAIEEISDGQVYLSQHITSRILSKVIQTEDYSTTSHLEELTDRELTVFRMLGEGNSVHQIAAQLDLDRKTVETYRRRAKEKLGYETVDELLHYATQWAGSQGENTGQEDDSA
ncbi:MAG: response regulator [Salinibacter sp.]|uniref:response regulator transcription factor n=1 Tax=Salinibacter sp. TaxID=2065818 RepID=UPI0035D4F240